MSEINERVGVDDLRSVVAQLGSKKVEEQIMTLAERLRQEGHERGCVTTQRANLRRVLIRRGLAVSPEELARIEACEDLDTLERWHDQAIDAASTADALR